MSKGLAPLFNRSRGLCVHQELSSELPRAVWLLTYLSTCIGNRTERVDSRGAFARGQIAQSVVLHNVSHAPFPLWRRRREEAESSAVRASIYIYAHAFPPPGAWMLRADNRYSVMPTLESGDKGLNGRLRQMHGLHRDGYAPTKYADLERNDAMQCRPSVRPSVYSFSVTKARYPT